MKIKLKRKAVVKLPNPTFSEIQWTRCLPFVLNPRGVLVHRVVAATLHVKGGVISHGSCDYWCGNGCCFNENIFLEAPPEGRILCFRCEMMAVLAGEMPADEIVGKHVHVGGVRAYRTCCQDEPSN